MRPLVCLAILSATAALRVHDGLKTSNLRILKEDDEAEGQENDNHDDAYENMIVNQSQQDDLAMAEVQDESTGNFFVDQVQQVKNTAEANAWDFYSHSPSEWTNAQWYAVLVIAAIFSATCCCLTGCIAYCLRSDNEEDYDEDEESVRFRCPRIICRRRRVRVRGEESPQRKREDNTDAKSHSTASSGKSFESFEIENDRNKPLLQQQEKTIRNISLVKSFEQILMPKTKSRSQKTTAVVSVKSDPSHYSRMKV